MVLAGNLRLKSSATPTETGNGLAFDVEDGAMTSGGSGRGEGEKAEGRKRAKQSKT